MKVHVHLHTILQKSTTQGPLRELTVDLNPGATLDELIDLLELEVNDENTLFVIQGQIVSRDQKLTENAEVHFIPAISGGCEHDRQDEITL